MQQYFDLQYFWDAFPQLLPYLIVTFYIVGSATVLGIFLGAGLTVMKLSDKKLLRKFANGYTTILRGTPSIVLLFLVYYGLPALFTIIQIDLSQVEKGYFVVIAFALKFAAMMSEVFRSSYEAVDKRQIEAGYSIGLTAYQNFYRIIFPQMFAVILPNFGNGLILLFQEGALAYTIGLIDIVGKAELIIALNYNTHALEIYLALAVIYWVLSIGIEKLFAIFERLYTKGRNLNVT